VSPERTSIGEYERRIAVFGSEVRIVVGRPSVSDAKPPELAALELEAFLRNFHRRLTRFDENSDLMRLNACPNPTCPVSPLLALAVRAAVWAAELSGGLVDPTLAGAIESAGYRRSLAGIESAPLSAALASAPARRPGQPRPDSSWRRITVDAGRQLVTRPAGVRLDLGGTAKGLAADLCAGRLANYELFAVDAGGDICVGGRQGRERLIEIASPFDNAPVFSFPLARGAVATSGISARIWRHGNRFAHHLLDPASGEPAWTGIVQATALADTALEAEVLAKAALLSGPAEGSKMLTSHGGVLVLDAGEVMVAGPLRSFDTRRAA
jgi:thiamine biosynthesis lipoprotein